MSGEPRDFDKLLGQFEEFRTCVSQGLRRVSQKRWQAWIGHSRTGEVTRLFYEMGPEAALVELGLQEPPPPLFRGLFRTIQDQAVRWHDWLPGLREEQGVDADLDVFLAEHEAPAWPGGNRLTAVTLTLRGPSAAQEFQLYWPLIAAQQEQSWKWETLKLDDDHMRWLKGSDNAANDWHFEWQVIDLGANRRTSSETVRQAHGDKPQPNAGVLAAAALHPEWIKSMNGKDVPYVDLPGYEVSVPGYRPWQDVPHLGFDRDRRRVWLRTDRCDYTDSGWAVPSLAGV